LISPAKVRFTGWPAACLGRWSDEFQDSALSAWYELPAMRLGQPDSAAAKPPFGQQDATSHRATFGDLGTCHMMPFWNKPNPSTQLYGPSGQRPTKLRTGMHRWSRYNMI